MIIVVLGDLHLGKGKFLKNGQLNILEDFDQDEAFVEFVNYYCSAKFKNKEVHLVLNGDILNLLQVDVHGVFTHVQTEEYVTKAVQSIFDGHIPFFDALKKFVNTSKKKLTYVIGNHDFGMNFRASQKLFSERVGGDVFFTDKLKISSVHIEHGHRFEPLNSVAPHKTFVKGPAGRRIVNLPWASLFCLHLLPVLKKERPYIDKLRPIPLYFRRAIFYDTRALLVFLWKVFLYVWKTFGPAHNRYNQNFKTSWQLLKTISIYPAYDKKAKKITRHEKDVDVVVMGHTHIAEWRRFPEGKYYFNTGTWNTISSVDAGMYRNITKLNYVLIELHEKTKHVTNAYLNVWQGEWRPYREEVSLTTTSFFK